MDRLRERVEHELKAAAAAGQEVTEVELSDRLAVEFSAECGQAEVRSVVISTMRRSMHHSPRTIPIARAKGLWR